MVIDKYGVIMQKTYILKFVDKNQALDILVPKGFGYIKFSGERILFQNMLGRAFLEELSDSENGFIIQLNIINNTPELEEYLSPYKDEGT